MRILQVIHGYPMRFNAGSEVYTQLLCHELSGRHEVQVFTRYENPFAPEYSIAQECDPDDNKVRLCLVNLPHSRDRYRHSEVDNRFGQLLDQECPDVVHVQHLNHLSTSLVKEAAKRQIPIIYTLHDYWLMCPRGQFMQMHSTQGEALWPACEGQDDRNCARRCYARYSSGDPDELKIDLAHWEGWVRRRMRHVREMVGLVDLFVAPSKYLMDRYQQDFGVPPSKLFYLDYGFDRERLRGRRRKTKQPFTFGYIGTHIPAKGIEVLLRAFSTVDGGARLRIWGRHRGQNTDALQEMTEGLDPDHRGRVEWLPEYHNRDIMAEVFNRVDVIVVPSIWVENSPLVIHEAQQARVPVITADVGGMAELVEDGINGLLFRHRDAESLAAAMRRMMDDRQGAACMGQRGYLASPDGDVPDIREHARAIDSLYRCVIRRRDTSRIVQALAPWRITFDTNPDDCNRTCIMCEGHSPQRPEEERAEKLERRRMPFSVIQQVVEECRGRGLREIIPSTMGEPLLYKHFDEVLELCADSGIKLNLTTNGSFRGRGAREWASLIVPVGSDVKISWNGATAATQEAIMRGSRWEDGLDNLRTFVNVRDEVAGKGGNYCRVTLQVTFLEDNVEELPDLVRLAARHGVDRVKGHHVWTHFPELEEKSLRRSADSIARWNRIVGEAHKAAEGTPGPGGKRVMLENVFPLEPDGGSDIAPGSPCPFLGQEAWISAEGRFDPCCAPDAQRRTLGEFGNLRDQSFMEIWQEEAYRFLLNTYRTRSLCMGCNMRRPLEAS